MRAEAIVPPSIVIRDTGTARGLGVFAVRPFSAGELVERCPVILFEARDFASLPQDFKRRTFDWSGLIAKRRGQLAFPLGYGTLYNHSNPANLSYSGLRSTTVLMFVANQTIQAGVELTINYDERVGFNPSSESSWSKWNDIQLI
jgi:uncharacterized protein